VCSREICRTMDRARRERFTFDSKRHSQLAAMIEARRRPGRPATPPTGAGRGRDRGARWFPVRFSQIVMIGKVGRRFSRFKRECDQLKPRTCAGWLVNRIV